MGVEKRCVMRGGKNIIFSMGGGGINIVFRPIRYIDPCCGWWVTTAADQSHPSVFYMYDWFFIRYVTLQMKKSIVKLLTGRLPPFFWFFVIGTVISACFFCRQVTIEHRRQSSLLLIIRRVTAWWETAVAWVFKSKSWKFLLKYLKMCSGNQRWAKVTTLRALTIFLEALFQLGKRLGGWTVGLAVEKG